MNTELSSAAKRLIEASRGFDEATFEDRARVRAGLSAQLAAGAGVIALGGASRVAGAKGWAVAALSGPLPKAALALAVATGVAVGVAARWPHTKTPVPVPSTATSNTTAASNTSQAAASDTSASDSDTARAARPALAEEARGLGESSAEPRSSATPAAPMRELAPKAQRTAAPAPVNADSARPPSAGAQNAGALNGDHLSEELKLLSAARSQLRQEAPERALERLREYRARFPAGALAVEGNALWIDALCGAGQKVAARAAAEDFLKAWPDSPLAGRVRAACQ